MKDSLLLTISAAAVAYYFVAKKSGAAAPAVKGATAPFAGPALGAPAAAGSKAPNYASQIAAGLSGFESVRKSLTGLWDSFGGNGASPDSGPTSGKFAQELAPENGIDYSTAGLDFNA